MLNKLLITATTMILVVVSYFYISSDFNYPINTENKKVITTNTSLPVKNHVETKIITKKLMNSDGKEPIDSIISIKAIKSVANDSTESNIRPMLDTILNEIHTTNSNNLNQSLVYKTIRLFMSSEEDLSSEYQKIHNMYANANSPNEKLFLISFLGNIDTPQSMETLFSIMDSETNPSIDIKIIINKALNDFIYNDQNITPNVHLVDTIEEYFSNTENTSYKNQVAVVLAKIGEVSSIKLVLNEFPNIDNSSKTEILEALSDINNEEATKELIQLYNDSGMDKKLQQNILNIIANHGNDSAVHALLDYATNAPDNESKQIKKLFEIAKKNSQNMESIIGNQLFDEGNSFKSNKVKQAIITTFKYEE